MHSTSFHIIDYSFKKKNSSLDNEGIMQLVGYFNTLLELQLM